MKNGHKRLLPGILVSCVLLGITVAGVSCVPVYEDCIWGTDAFAWVDENKNGQFDDGEVPLENVKFHVDDTLNNYKDVGSKAISDWNGKASIYVGLPGCPRVKFEVYAVPPAGYQFTTDQRVKVQGKGYGNNEDTLQFGFARMDGYPTPTPYVSKLTCQQKYSNVLIRDLVLGPDGTMWLLRYGGIASFDKTSDTWTEHLPDTRDMDFFEQLQVGASGIVWANKFDEHAARLQDGRWVDFTGEDNLVAFSQPSIGTTPDGRVWFARDEAFPLLIAFDPRKDTWQLYSGDVKIESVRAFTDGTVWRAAFGSESKFAIPENAPKDWTFYDEHIFTSDETLELPIQGAAKPIKIAPDGTIWFAHAQGLTRFDPATNEWYSYDRSSTNGILSDVLNDLAFAPDGSIWIATGYAHPVAIQFIPDSADSKTGTWLKYDPRDGIPDFKKLDIIEADPEGGIWFSSTHGDTVPVARCVKSIP